MIHASFLNGYLIDCKDTRAYLASEYLEEWNGVLDATEVGWDLDPPPQTVVSLWILEEEIPLVTSVYAAWYAAVASLRTAGYTFSRAKGME